MWVLFCIFTATVLKYWQGCYWMASWVTPFSFQPVWKQQGRLVSTLEKLWLWSDWQHIQTCQPFCVTSLCVSLAQPQTCLLQQGIKLCLKKGCSQQDKRLLKTWITASQLYASVHQYAAVPELWRWIIGTTSEKYDVAVHSTPDLLAIKHHNVLLDICVKCLPNYCMNYWVMAQNGFFEVTVTLTCDIRPPNSFQISSSLSYSWHLDQI